MAVWFVSPPHPALSPSGGEGCGGASGSVEEDAGVDVEHLTGDAVRLAEGQDLVGHVLHAGCALEGGARRREVIRVPSMSPGATQFTETSGARATARQRVRWISPALLVAYAMLLPPGLSPATEAMLTMRPAPLFLRCGAAARQTKYGPRRFVANRRSQISGLRASRSGKGMLMFHAALLTRMSRRP